MVILFETIQILSTNPLYPFDYFSVYIGICAVGISGVHPPISYHRSKTGGCNLSFLIFLSDLWITADDLCLILN